MGSLIAWASVEARKKSRAVDAPLLIPAVAYWFLALVPHRLIWPRDDVFGLDLEHIMPMFFLCVLSSIAWVVTLVKRHHVAIMLATWSPLAHGVGSVLLYW